MRTLTLVTLCLAGAGLPAQTTWFIQAGAAPGGNGSVLAPFSTVQTAMTLAGPGDTILVGPGTYVGDVDFLGKAVTLRSSAGPAATTLQGTGTGSVVKFVSGEGTASVIRGFRITGGDNTMHGGGVWTLAAQPRIEDCLIIGNTAYDGGGITNSSGSATVISGCTIVGNVAWAGAYAGGGIRCSSSSSAVTIHDCILWDNNSGISGAPTLVQNCIVQGGWSGPGNLSSDPVFVMPFAPPAQGDFALTPLSPAIGSGTQGRDRGAIPYSDPPLRLTMSQAGGTLSSLTIANSGGEPGAPYLSLFTVDPANLSSPGAGAFFGLHVSLVDLVFQVAAVQPPYQGQLGANGDSAFVLPGGAIPPGLTGTTFHGLSLTLDFVAAQVLESSVVASVTLQ